MIVSPVCAVFVHLLKILVWRCGVSAMERKDSDLPDRLSVCRGRGVEVYHMCLGS